MALFVKEGGGNKLLNRSSQKTIEQLQGISAVDMAMAIPYLKITRVDPETRKPAAGVPPLNVFLQKPPSFGLSMVGNGRFAERPPASLESFSVSTKQNYGHIIEQHIEMKVIAHRPSAVFDSGDSVWASLITPGETHLVEYGWAGSSKNGLVNGEGFDDEDALGGRTFIPSRKSILFTTYYYTFAIRNTGEIEFSIKGMQNGNLVFRQIQLGDVLETDTDINITNAGRGRVPSTSITERNRNSLVRKKLQGMLDQLAKNSIKRKKLKPVVSLIDVLNVLLADTVTSRCTQWGYDSIDMVIGKFNPRVAPTTPQFQKPSDEIGDFMIPVDSVRKVITGATRKNTTLTIENFIENLLSATVNRATTWAPGRLDEKSRLSSRVPQVMVKVVDESTNTKKRIRISIFDSVRDLIALFPEENRLFGKDIESRSKIKDKLVKAKVPFLSLGHASSFIMDANFDVIMDPQIQRAKIDAAAKFLKARSDVTSRSLRDLIKDSPNEYHQIFSSAIQGTITMLGNFAFDTFASMWLDFQISIWDGPFVVRQRTDTVTPAGFETTLEVYSEGTDPLNTKRRLSKNQVAAMEEVRLATQELAESSRARGGARKRAQQSARDRLSSANEKLRQASIPKPKRPKSF